MKTLFKCQFCGNTSESAMEISKCESGHFQVEDCVIESTFDHRRNCPHPNRVKITFPDGEAFTYMLL